jgi:hypothetical protein
MQMPLAKGWKSHCTCILNCKMHAPLRSFTVCDVQLDIKLNPDLGNGGLVWPSTFFLAEYLKHSATPIRGLSIAELGSGTGLLGIWLATQGANVVLTDLPELVPLLQDNVSLNMDQISKGGGSIHVEAVCWGEKADIPAAVMDCSLIVGSDLVHWIGFRLFDEDTRCLLCQTMCTLLRRRSDKKIYVCHEIRTEQREAQFVQMINEAGLCSREERVITYSPWSASGDAPPSGFMFHGFGERASELSRISCEGLCLTVQSSTELDCEKRDVVILQVSSA